MRKIPNAQWIRIHTIALIDQGPAYSPEGLIAVVDGNEAGIVGYTCDTERRQAATAVGGERSVNEVNMAKRGPALRYSRPITILIILLKEK